MKIIDYKFVYSDDKEVEEDKDHYVYDLLINFDDEYVETNCGDSYYDYSISFDIIIKLADYIKSNKHK